MNLITKAMQIVTTTLLASAGLLHLATFFVAVPGFSAVALALLIVSVALAAVTYMSLYHFTFFTFYSFPYRTNGIFAMMDESRDRKAEAESQVYSHISQKESAILGSAAGYLFLNALFCLILCGTQMSKLSGNTAEAQLRRETLADCYLGRFLSGCALLPATAALLGFHVTFPKLIEESQPNPESTVSSEKSRDELKKINKDQPAKPAGKAGHLN